LSRETTPRRASAGISRGAEAVWSCRRQHQVHRFGEVSVGSARSETSRMLGNNLSGTGRSRCPTVAAPVNEGRKCSARGEASRHKTTSHRRGKSDRGVVPVKLPNKAVGDTPAAAEAVEGRPRAKGRVRVFHLRRTSRRVTQDFGATHPRRSLTSVAADRQHLRQEPYAVVPHVRICAGGGERSPSLPRRAPGRPVGCSEWKSHTSKE
jgi:hypothetical protein